MQRTIEINGKAAVLKPTANFMFYYRRARLSGEGERDFQKDLQILASMQDMEKSIREVDETNALEVLRRVDMFAFSDIIRRLLWTFIFSGDKSIPPFEQWCDELESYDITQAAKTVMELIEENFFLMLGVPRPGPKPGV